MLSIRTDDRRLSIAYPLMKANRRNFETQRRAEVRNALQQNIKVQQKTRHQLSLFESISIDLSSGLNLVPGSNVLSDVQVKEARRESLALRDKLLSADRQERFHQGFGN